MAMLGHLRYQLLLRRKPRRYSNLFRIIFERRCRRIVEIGTWNGVHARQMIQTAALHHPVRNVEYHGFDLWELLTDEEFQKEFSKRPPRKEVVRESLESTGAQIHLYQGDTKETLPQVLDRIRNPDLIFVDGGHSLETIASDWHNIEQVLGENTVVVFDDYYHNQEPDIRSLGCRTLIDGLDRTRYQVEVMQPMDRFPKPWGQLEVSMARVQRRPAGEVSR